MQYIWSVNIEYNKYIPNNLDMVESIASTQDFLNPSKAPSDEIKALYIPSGVIFDSHLINNIMIGSWIWTNRWGQVSESRWIIIENDFPRKTSVLTRRIETSRFI